MTAIRRSGSLFPQGHVEKLGIFAQLPQSAS
jgi:hypothetical protein